MCYWDGGGGVRTSPVLSPMLPTYPPIHPSVTSNPKTNTQCTLYRITPPSPFKPPPSSILCPGPPPWPCPFPARMKGLHQVLHSCPHTFPPNKSHIYSIENCIDIANIRSFLPSFVPGHPTSVFLPTHAIPLPSSFLSPSLCPHS